MKLRGRNIQMGQTPYLVAELSANHDHRLEHALATIRAAKDAGADAVKIQTYTSDTLTIASNRPGFVIEGGTIWDGKSLYDLYADAHTPWEWTEKLKQATEDLGMGFFSTAYDPSAVDFLEKLGVEIHKVASFEIVDLGLIQKMAETKKPVIISTGMASLTEIEDAVTTAKTHGAPEVMLLKCTSSYPAPFEEMNLATIPDLARRFQVAVGLSDHSVGSLVPVAATSFGVCLIEKHFTLSRKIKTADSSFSMEPQEFKEMATNVRNAHACLGKISYGPTESSKSSTAFRRSLYVVKSVKAGQKLTTDCVRSIRPGFGLAPKYLPTVLNKIFTQDLAEGTPLSWEHLEE